MQAMCNSAPPQTGRLASPVEMVRHLDRYMVGQAHAKKTLSTAIYQHYLGKSFGLQHPGEANPFGRNHVLLCGPTGVGKTYLVRLLAEHLGVPVVFGVATALVGVGYVGETVDSLLEALLRQTNGKVPEAQRGIIVIDEIDKIRRQSCGGHRDISGETVQEALLSLLDGRTCRGLDTSGLLFICTGAFEGLSRIVEARLNAGRAIGFQERVQTEADRGTGTWMRDILPEDLQSFGFLAEFVGRFPAIIGLDPLSREDLKKILVHSEDSVLARQRRIYDQHGIQLCYEETALEAVADQAVRLGTGARGLDQVLKRSLEKVNWRLPELAEEGVGQVCLTAGSVLGTAEPKLCRRPVRARAIVSPAEKLRQLGVGVPASDGFDSCALAQTAEPAEPTVGYTGAPPISNTVGWPVPQIWSKIEQVKASFHWDQAGEEARGFWQNFEVDRKDQPAMILRMAEEIARRVFLGRLRGLDDFHELYLESKIQNCLGVLHFVDYMAMKRQEEEWNAAAESATTPDDVSEVEEGRTDEPEAEGETSSEDEASAEEDYQEVLRCLLEGADASEPPVARTAQESELGHR